MKLLNKIGKFFNYLAKYNTLKLRYEIERKAYERMNAKNTLKIDELEEMIKEHKKEINTLKKAERKRMNSILEKKYNVRAE